MTVRIIPEPGKLLSKFLINGFDYSAGSQKTIAVSVIPMTIEAAAESLDNFDFGSAPDSSAPEIAQDQYEYFVSISPTPGYTSSSKVTRVRNNLYIGSDHTNPPLGYYLKFDSSFSLDQNKCIFTLDISKRIDDDFVIVQAFIKLKLIAPYDTSGWIDVFGPYFDLGGYGRIKTIGQLNEWTKIRFIANPRLPLTISLSSQDSTLNFRFDSYSFGIDDISVIPVSVGQVLNPFSIQYPSGGFSFNANKSFIFAELDTDDKKRLRIFEPSPNGTVSGDLLSYVAPYFVGFDSSGLVIGSSDPFGRYASAVKMTVIDDGWYRSEVSYNFRGKLLIVPKGTATVDGTIGHNSEVFVRSVEGGDFTVYFGGTAQVLFTGIAADTIFYTVPDDRDYLYTSYFDITGDIGRVGAYNTLAFGSNPRTYELIF
ncbi:MAG: hypothetical protein LBK74_07900 [Treponema sp.]|nr:hypothetical protein [Treponema sp.]